MSSADVPVSPVPPTPPPFAPVSVKVAHRVLRLLCTSNPFYVVSAALFLFGLRASFGPQASDIDSWALMGGLAGYTLLLAAAALILVRFACVWNDVRTVLLLVVLMFLATSVTFDELLVMEPERGTWFFVGGLAFAIGLSELLLRGIRLRLPLLFRLPYHLSLALFFLYPLVLVPVLGDPHGELLMWGLWGFAPAAGWCSLTSSRRSAAGRATSAATAARGRPFYPWSVFVFSPLPCAGARS